MSNSKYYSKKFRACLELIRPANVVTAFADILAGFFIAGGVILYSDGNLNIQPDGLFWLLLSTFGLYGGGITFNDVFDAELDAIERPERAIPSGRITRSGASLFGSVLLILGISFAFLVNITAGLISIGITACALIYNVKAKHSDFFGPLCMGSCRGGNLLLGCSIIPSVLVQVWFLALIPVVYIGSITLVSQGEVHGGKKLYGYFAAGLIFFVVLSFFGLSFLFADYHLVTELPFILLFAALVIPPFLSAASTPEPLAIRKAVKRGVISLVLINTIFAAGFAGFLSGLVVLLFFFLAILISRYFRVT